MKKPQKAMNEQYKHITSLIIFFSFFEDRRKVKKCNAKYDVILLSKRADNDDNV